MATLPQLRRTRNCTYFNKKEFLFPLSFLVLNNATYEGVQRNLILFLWLKFGSGGLSFNKVQAFALTVVVLFHKPQEFNNGQCLLSG